MLILLVWKLYEKITFNIEVLYVAYNRLKVVRTVFIKISKKHERIAVIVDTLVLKEVNYMQVFCIKFQGIS